MARFVAVLVSLSATVWMGCGSTYQYYGDPSQTLQSNRYHYVKYNPGAPHNNQILAGKIQPGMSADEIRASWGSPTAVAPGDLPQIDEVWAYHDPEESHGNAVWLLRFSSGTLHKVEKLIGMQMTGVEGASGDDGAAETASSIDKP